MISGVVSQRRATPPVTFRLPGRSDLTIEFIVDIGFAGFLTLPAAAVAALGLPFRFDTTANLADDSNVNVAVHGATVVWHGVEIAVRVLSTGKRPLLGMALLEGSELLIQCAENGLVTVDLL